MDEVEYLAERLFQEIKRIGSLGFELRTFEFEDDPSFTFIDLVKVDDPKVRAAVTHAFNIK
jgi:hypothetical protein